MTQKDKSIDPNDAKLYEALDTYIASDQHQIRKLSAGDIVEGSIVDIRPGAIVVDVGYKSEGVVAGKELKSETIDVRKLEVGDVIYVYVVKPEDDQGLLVLSIRRTQQAGQWRNLEKAKVDNSVVEATVIESNNGGVIVDLGNGVRGFIPTSQLDATRVYLNGQRQVGKDISSKVNRRLTDLVGEKIKTRIIELDREKNKIVLSEKQASTSATDIQKREATLRKIKEGDVLKGEITGIAPFGVFVNGQGLDGLVHLSELSWDKVENIDSIYKVGDKVDVMVIGVTDGGKRVAYSVKRLQKDPWSQAIAKFKVGDVVEGEVQRVVDYGAFVRIGEGLNGLIHISEISDKLVKNPRDYITEGQKVQVKILSISSTERHLGLSLKAGSGASGSGEESPAKKEATKEDLAKAVDEAVEKEIA